MPFSKEKMDTAMRRTYEAQNPPPALGVFDRFAEASRGGVMRLYSDPTFFAVHASQRHEQDKKEARDKRRKKRGGNRKQQAAGSSAATRNVTKVKKVRYDKDTGLKVLEIETQAAAPLDPSIAVTAPAPGFAPQAIVKPSGASPRIASFPSRAHLLANPPPRCSPAAAAPGQA